VFCVLLCFVFCVLCFVFCVLCFVFRVAIVFIAVGIALIVQSNQVVEVMARGLSCVFTRIFSRIFNIMRLIDYSTI
jgi:uncharacterized membrane-anchored protein YitT (DUF2179 family)